MNIRPLAVGAVLALLLSPFAPAVAQAAAPAVTGTVTVDGVPVADTEVGWFDPTTRAAGETRTSSTGTYSLTVTEGHPFVLYAGVDYSATGDGVHEESATWTSLGGTTYVPAFQGVDGVPDYMYQGRPLFPAGTGAVTANIDLDKPGSIVATSTVMKNRNVQATSEYGLRLAGAKADAAGSVTIGGLIPGTYRLNVPSLQVSDYFQSQTVQVRPGETTQFVPVFPVQEKGEIRGVVKAGGKRLKNIEVSALGNKSGGGARTDSQGRYVIKYLAKGTYKLAFNTGQEGYYPNNVWVTTSGTATVTLKTGQSKTVNKQLTVGGTVVAAVTATAKATKLNLALFDAKGRIVGGSNFDPKTGTATAVKLVGVRAGTFTALFTDTEQKFYAKRTITVRLGATTNLGAIKLDRRTVSVSGRVLGAKSANVGFSSPSYYQSLYGSAKNGKYRLSGLIPGVKGQLSVGGAYREARTYSFTAKATSTTKTLRLGAQYGTIRTELTAGGYPVIVGSISISKKGEFEDALQIKKDGTATRKFEPGKARIQLVPDRASFYQFVANAPFWISIPSSAQVVTVRSGKVTDTGPIELDIHR